MATEVVFEGECLCGRYQLTCRGEPFVALCHCNACRRAYGTVAHWLASFKYEEVTLTKGKLSDALCFQSGNRRNRYRCEECAQMLFAEDETMPSKSRRSVCAMLLMPRTDGVPVVPPLLVPKLHVMYQVAVQSCTLCAVLPHDGPGLQPLLRDLCLFQFRVVDIPDGLPKWKAMPPWKGGSSEDLVSDDERLSRL